MDIIILMLLTITALLMWREAPSGVILGTWALALLLMAGLFKFHVSSTLGLSF